MLALMKLELLTRNNGPDRLGKRSSHSGSGPRLLV